MGDKLLQRMRKKPEYKKGLKDLITYVNNIHPVSEMSILEIGSYLGESSLQFAKKFKKVYCVDPWENGYDDTDYASWKYDLNEVYEVFKKRIESFDNVTVYRTQSLNAARYFLYGQLDMVYIDGNHQPEAVKRDLENWFPFVKESGFITGHDYDDKHFSLQKVINNFCGGVPEALFIDSSWCIQKESIKKNLGLDRKKGEIKNGLC